MYPHSAKNASDELIIDSRDHAVTGASSDCISRVRFSPKECPIKLLGATAWDGSCSVWQLQVDPAGQVVSTPSWTTTHCGPLLDMIFSSDGRAFFGGCSQTALVWDLEKNVKNVVAAHDLPISCLSFLSAAQVGTDMLITGSWDGCLRWWDLRTPNFVKEEKFGEPIFALDAQKFPPAMAVATGRTVHIYDLHSMNKVKEVKPPSMMRFNIRSVACSPQFDGVVIGSAEGRLSFAPFSDDVLKACTWKAHMSSDTIGGSNAYIAYQVNFTAHHPNLPILFCGGGDGAICGFNRSTKKTEKGCSMDCAVHHENRPISISAGDVSGDGLLLAYAHSYDWSLGKMEFRNQPSSIHVRTLYPARK